MLIKTDVCVIGAGSGGLSVAVGAAQMGASTILVEHLKMGGDCLNYGCVPSKALIAAGKMAHLQEVSDAFGVHANKVSVNRADVHKHIQEVIQHIAPHDSVERMESLGIRVIRETAHFLDEKHLQVGPDIIHAKRYVIATGSSPKHPDIPGIDEVPFYTNESIFKVQRPIEHLLIIGGGPIGIEMAQAHRRLGSRVTVLESFKILPRDDVEIVDIVRQRLLKEGVEIHEGVELTQISVKDGTITIKGKNQIDDLTVHGTHLLVAAGRIASVAHLQLDLAGVKYTQKGISVNSRLRTTNRNIYAIGDVIGQHQFTHAASYHASIVIQNMLFRFPKTVDGRKIPWVTYTDPEIAHVGLGEAEARDSHMDYKVLRFPLSENDRAQCERKTEGLIKAILANDGRILGVTICADRAGELISFWVLAISKDLRMKDIANLVLPYPTYSEIHKGISSAYYKPILFSNKVRAFVRFLLKFG